MYCVIKIENHPDALIDAVYGPYANYEAADQDADIMSASSDNYNEAHKHRLYDYEVKELIEP